MKLLGTSASMYFQNSCYVPSFHLQDLITHKPIDMASLFALLISNWLYKTLFGIATLAKN